MAIIICQLPLLGSVGLRSRSSATPVARKARLDRSGAASWSRSSARRIASRCLRWRGDQRADVLHLRKRFGGFQASDVRRQKPLEAENARLKKLVAERDLEIEVMKDAAAKIVSVPAARGRLRIAGSVVSRRGGSAAFSVARSALSYQAARSPRTHPWSSE
jgi:putative transposase